MLVGEGGQAQPVPRVNDPAPCGTESCPRSYRGLEAWNSKNEKTYRLWLEGRAMGFTDEQKADPLLRWHVAILEDTARLADARLLARMVWGA